MCKKVICRKADPLPRLRRRDLALRQGFAAGAAAFLAVIFFSGVALAAVFFAVAIIFSFVDLHKTPGFFHGRTIQSDVELRIARNTNLLHAKTSVFIAMK